MSAHLAVQYDAAAKTWQVLHVTREGASRVLMEVHDHTDAVRIARGIASWTALSVIERA